ncbi:hypothetical protein, partial [Sansalvadorimonas verongulae]|uniref:hypothetical protein n=1 Tax=Sansalvadorimonas verongulae TaxID=2172824 RepID=UPI0018AD2B40
HAHSGGLMSVQVYQDGHQAMNADVVVNDAEGRMLAQGKTNSHGWVNLRTISSNQTVEVKAETADGQMAAKEVYVETKADRK